MVFSKRYKERALELFNQYSTKEVFQHLAKAFPETPNPDERTLRRWRKLTEINQNKIESTRQKTKAHLNQLSRVAKTLLSEGLSGINRTGEDEYEYDRADDDQYAGEIVPFTMNLEEIKKSLHQNIENAYDKHRNYDLFDYFLIHLTSSIPNFPNPDKADLHKLANTSPLELIASLKMLALKRDFKGKCNVCDSLAS
jgi:hypothetical protein